MAKKSDLMLWGGAAVVLGIVAVGTYLVWGTPEGVTQISLNVVPNEVQKDSNQTVTASGNVIVNGRAADPSHAIYIRVKEPPFGSYTGTITRYGASFSEPIPTTGKPTGDYVVEVSDSPFFI